MANFISNFFDIYINEVGRIFNSSYETLLHMLFCIVLLTVIFKFIVRRKG